MKKKIDTLFFTLLRFKIVIDEDGGIKSYK